MYDLGHVITSFTDDSLLVGQTEEDIVHSVTDTIKVFDSLGFVMHEEKSRFMPTQQITYLGFEINSCDMSITLTTERKHKLREACLELLRQTKVKIRTAVPCVGLKVPASWLCQWAHCTTVLRECKKKVLTDNHGNWEKNTQTSDKDKTELKWRIDHILEQKAHSESRSISHTENRQLSLRLGSTED